MALLEIALFIPAMILGMGALLGFAYIPIRTISAIRVLIGKHSRSALGWKLQASEPAWLYWWPCILLGFVVAIEIFLQNRTLNAPYKALFSAAFTPICGAIVLFAHRMKE